MALVSDQKRKITVLLEADEFSRFESYCARQGFKKSTLIVRLIRDHLDVEAFECTPRLGHTSDIKEPQR